MKQNKVPKLFGYSIFDLPKIALFEEFGGPLL